MFISQVRLQGFRNFKDATINLDRTSLVIGSNEIGKSNLLHGLRILLDKTLSQVDLEPQDQDFYAHEETNEICILARFEEAVEECVVSKFREHISEEGVLYLAYSASRDSDSRVKSFHFSVGRSVDTLKDIEANRFYLRVLSLKFMASSRDLLSFIRRERRNLLQDARAQRTEDEIVRDSEKLSGIERNLAEVRKGVSSLSYVSKATRNLNSELAQLSVQNEGQEIVFDTGAAEPAEFVDNLRLAAQVGERVLSVGGDGRNNQIQLALWAARNRPAKVDEDPLEVCIFCIEEPEAHLHPHQQRKLANYLADRLPAQVIITTHSPQIACGFPPASIVRLYDNGPDTLAASGGSSPKVEQALVEFGHRLNIIPAETFFSSVVLLVEGPSEELFYKALAERIGVDLDRLNISVLMVDGVGFLPYANLLHSLKIPFVVRTDNDVFKVPKRMEYRFAGIQRGVELYRKCLERDPAFEETLREHEAALQGFSTPNPPEQNLESAKCIAEGLEKSAIYLSAVDLETDLKRSNICPTLAQFFADSDEDHFVTEMQKRKATFMFSFLRQNADSLGGLADDIIARPLLRCRQIATAIGDRQ